MCLINWEGELGYLGTTLVLTGEARQWETLRWWVEFDVPCCGLPGASGDVLVVLLLDSGPQHLAPLDQ